MRLRNLEVPEDIKELEAQLGEIRKEKEAAIRRGIRKKQPSSGTKNKNLKSRLRNVRKS